MAEAKPFIMIPHVGKDEIGYEIKPLVLCKDCKYFESFEPVLPWEHDVTMFCWRISDENGENEIDDPNVRFCAWGVLNDEQTDSV